MAKLYGKIGSLTHLLTILNNNRIYGFETLNDIRSFRNNYKNSLEEIRKRCEDVLQKEIINLKSSCEKLKEEIGSEEQTEEGSLRGNLRELLNQENEKDPKEFAEYIGYFFKRIRTLWKKMCLENRINKKSKSLLRIQDDINDKKDNPDKWIERYASNDINKVEKTLAVFKENRHLFYGAEGEEKVASELSKLPDTYTVINDYYLNFAPPIYNRENDDRIYSVQIDHIVLGPTGIYLIETKNWSKSSTENTNLFSPIKQLQRHNYAMFVLLNQAVKRGEMGHLSNHWGNKKISPKNIICMTGHKPQQEFQYVKILSLGELIRYISYRNQVYSEDEVEDLTDCLFKI